MFEEFNSTMRLIPGDKMPGMADAIRIRNFSTLVIKAIKIRNIEVASIDKATD